MLRQIALVVLTLNATLFAVADDAADIQTNDIELNALDTKEDTMANFLTVVAHVQRMDIDTSVNKPGRNHLRHLGLGFAHGRANINTLGTNAVSNSNTNNIGSYVYGTGNSNVNPHNDACNGNGHTGNISHDTSSNDIGTHSGNSNGFSLTDCGDPSPSD